MCSGSEMGGHGGHHGSCSHEHTGVDPAEMGVMYSLYQKIDIDHVTCLNEAVDESGRLVFKPWQNRLDKDMYVDSDADSELLFNIPFTGNIKLKGIILIGGEDGSHPSKIRLFKNRPHMTFDDVSVGADQEFEVHLDPNGVLEYSTKVVTFSSVSHLSIHVPDSMSGEPPSRVYYIGLRGEYSDAHRHGVTVCNYELLPSASDIDNPLKETSGHHVS